MVLQSPTPVTVDGGDQCLFVAPEHRRSLQVFMRRQVPAFNLPPTKKGRDNACPIFPPSVLQDDKDIVFRQIAPTHALAGMV
jgi:hypothetical protein